MISLFKQYSLNSLYHWVIIIRLIEKWLEMIKNNNVIKSIDLMRCSTTFFIFLWYKICWVADKKLFTWKIRKFTKYFAKSFISLFNFYNFFFFFNHFFTSYQTNVNNFIILMLNYINPKIWHMHYVCCSYFLYWWIKI